MKKILLIMVLVTFIMGSMTITSAEDGATVNTQGWGWTRQGAMNDAMGQAAAFCTEKGGTVGVVLSSNVSCGIFTCDANVSIACDDMIITKRYERTRDSELAKLATFSFLVPVLIKQ